jgi:hypothetical protein
MYTVARLLDQNDQNEKMNELNLKGTYCSLNY